MADNLFESCLLCSDASCGELSLNLGKPDFGVSGPEGWQFDADCGKGWVGSGGGITGGSESSPTCLIMGAPVVAIFEVERGELSVHQGSRSQGHQCCRFATNGC